MLIAGTMGDGSWASGRNLLALRPAAPPDIAAEPVALDFGERDIDDGPSPALAILAVNQGLGALRFGVPAFAIVGPDAASFAIVGSPAADPLAPGESVAVAIAFDPARTGLHEASLAIATNDPDSPVLSVPLSGGGIQTPGAASLGDLSGNGEGEMQLRWANPNTAPLAFFAMAYDVYEEEFVSFDGFGSALPVAPDATSATLPLAFTGAYHAWIGSYYPDGAWFVSDPMTAILYGGLPHAPRRVQVEPVLGQGQVRLRWKTDLYGVWHYQIVCYKHSEGFVAVDGPSAALGIEPWTFVDYGGLAFDAARASFIEGWADFRLPGPGVYTFFIRGVSWMDPHWGGAYGTATAFVLP